ncbi:unnamed protein product [Linum trigynum]|uniref:Uncharacterized protein n=1 Tax=Linum trigynum TaxID=586398 RepID=A0AAV2D5F9_9ROSI
MLRYNVALLEEYFISSFVSGLEEDLRPIVTMMRPQSLVDALKIAKLEEASNEAKRREWKTVARASPAFVNHDSGNGARRWEGNIKPLPVSKPSSAPYSKGNYPKGSCYKCGDKYFFGHVCEPKKQLNALQSHNEVVIPLVD